MTAIGGAVRIGATPATLAPPGTSGRESPLACALWITGLSVALSIALSAVSAWLGLGQISGLGAFICLVMCVGMRIGERSGALQTRRWRLQAAAYTMAGDAVLVALAVAAALAVPLEDAAQAESMALFREVVLSPSGATVTAALVAAVVAFGFPLTYWTLRWGEKLGVRNAQKRREREAARA